MSSFALISTKSSLSDDVISSTNTPRSQGHGRCRAKAARVYPRELAISICEGIAAQKRIEALGITPQAMMSVESMRQAAKAGIDECPAEAMHDTGCEGMEAFDDVSGQLLDPALMIKARKSEIEYFRDMGAYEKVDAKECWNIICQGTHRSSMGRHQQGRLRESHLPQQIGRQRVQHRSMPRVVCGEATQQMHAHHAERGGQRAKSGRQPDVRRCVEGILLC